MHRAVKASVAFFFTLALAVAFQFTATEAQAQSTYFTSQGCVNCHSAPVVATCNGCHAHGTHPSSAKSSINVAGTTNKASYAPGETVTVTMTGGYRTGWFRATLFDQDGVTELARSTGNDSGMGSSATYPAVLTAPAPSTAGTYTWVIAWYGNQYDASGAAFGAKWTPDPGNGSHGWEKVNLPSFTVAAAADTTAPVVGAFTLPATATSLTVPVSTFTATDNVAVTGYLVTTSATAPAASAAGWTATAPASVTAPAAGNVTFYGWAKDAAGNVSLAKSAAVTITLPDTTAPVVSAFTLPATATSLTVPVSTFTATDNVAVTGYLVTTSATAPAASAAGWTATAPASVTAPAAGNVTFYGWAKDAAGNVSLAKSVAVTITLPDTTAPVVGAFTLPATATSLTVPVSTFTATDNVAVTGYLVTTSATAPAASAAGWTATAPASVTAPAAGNVTFYGWAKDAAGNVSLAMSAAVTITLPDTTAPVVGAFTLPATATSLTVPVSTFTATDNVAVTGYLVTTSATAPAASAAGWTATAPASVTAPAAGNVTFYGWAKDAAGNVSLAKSAAVTITLPDTTAPVVGAFTLPATATSLTVPVSTFTATDNVAVTGYLVTTSATAPAASAAGWTATAPASVTAPAAGNVTFYGWAKDAAGNVSLAMSAAVTITLPDTTAPVVGAFTLPATATSLTVPVSTFTATDNVAVTGYLVTTSATAPAASAAGWTATAPASVTAPAAGNVTFYGWAKDAAGNVSLAKSAAVTITLPDTTAPVISAFTLPATATSLTVPVSTFTATDDVAVTGYLVTTSATAPAAGAAGWTATAPASVTAPAAGSVTFYGWAKDAAGNVSLAKSVAVTITLPDTTAPVVGAFTLPTTATSLVVPVTTFTATDNVAVTGYLVTTSATAPAAGAAGWTATAPASVTAVAGSNTFFAWAKDAAGNVSLSKSASVTVTLPDTTAPVVGAFTLPATATSLVVPVTTFTATDDLAVTGYLVTTSATAPAASAAGWTATAPASVTAPAAGNVTFYGWAKDAAGNVSLAKSAAVTITLPDTTAPVVGAFTLPATATSLTVPVSTFTATDNVAVTGYLVTTSATAPAASAAGWTATAPASVTAPAAGNVTFYGWAKDAAGNVSLAMSAAVTITITPVDTTKPTLTVSALADGSYTINVTLNVSGSASDSGGLKSVTVNGQAVTVNPDGSFSTALTLNTGANTITVVATDNAGNQAVDTRTITYDPAAPVLTVSTPADNSTTTQAFVTVTGTVNETSTVTVKDNNGTPQSATMTGNSYSATVNLVPGVNTIEIDATDLAGNISNAKRTVTYTAPTASLTLAVTSPNHDITTNQSSLVLKGNVTDTLGKVNVKITMNGRSYTPRVDAQGSFQQRLTFTLTRAEKNSARKSPDDSTGKLYTVTVTATDAAGNSSVVTRNIIYNPSTSTGGGDD